MAHKSRFPKLFAALLLLALAAPAQATSADRSFRGSFTIVARGMRAGTFSYQFTQTGERYNISAQRRLTGIARTMMGANQDFHYSASGVVADGALHPRAYEHQGGRREADRPNGRVVRVSFGAEVNSTATPPQPMGDPPASAAQRRGSVDQLTAIASLITADNPCGRTLRVFLDGHARFDFVLGAGAPVAVTTPVRGQGVRCAVQYRPLAGFARPQQAATLHFIFARTAAGLWAPISFELPTDAAGIVRLQATAVSVNGAAVS